MIIAWGLFIFSTVAFIALMKQSIIDREFDFLDLFILIIVALCSAQYIWG